MAKSRSHHSSIKILSVKSPELNKKISHGYGLPQLLNPENYDIFYIEIEKTSANILGIQLTDTCVVHSVNREDVDVTFCDLWLELNGTWLENKKHFTEIYRKMKKEANGCIKLKLKIARLLWKWTMPEDRMPMDILPRREYKYHLAVMYGIPGMHLTLGLKAINGKIFVSGVSEETLGRMAFAVGDSILDVERCMVSNITGAYDLIKQSLKTHGLVTCVVERADSNNASFFVREAIRSEKNLFKEERLNKDVEKICRKEKRRLLREPDAHPMKSILKVKKIEEQKKMRVRLKSKHDIVNINADINPKLLQSVPSHNALPSDTLLAPGRSAESILSEISSEASTEEQTKVSKGRPMRQKDCRLTTGTKVMKKKTTETSGRVNVERKMQPSSAGGDSSPKNTQNNSDSGNKIENIATSKTQNTGSGKKAITTLKTQNTDSGKKCSTTSKTPNDTDSRKKTSSTTTVSKTPQDSDIRRKNNVIIPKSRTKISKGEPPEKNNSGKNNSIKNVR